MTENLSENTRLAARVILIDDQDRILYFRAREPKSGNEFWVMPGGGVEEGESYQDAAIGETFEETGIHVALGPCVWTRRHKLIWDGRPADQYERFFIARTLLTELSGLELDSYIHDYKWWTLSELRESGDDFAPRNIRELLPPILKGDFPEEPFDCGV